MEKNLTKILQGYQTFRKKYALGDESVMQNLAHNGQEPKTMVLACCDSRVDPALILQCDPGDLFVVRNVANIVPPYEKDTAHHGTSAALEFGIRFLKIQHLILLGHSQCGGILSLINADTVVDNDFITSWVSLVKSQDPTLQDADDYAKMALNHSHQNCLSFPWIQEAVRRGELQIHLWFFNIKKGQIFTYSEEQKKYLPL